VNGHGTFCAGVAAGTTYGVAKNATIVAVKVVKDNGNGVLSAAIAGLDYIARKPIYPPVETWLLLCRLDPESALP